MSSQFLRHNFLITGASSGFGLSLALLCLRRGHRVIGTARNPATAAKNNPQLEEGGGKWLALDVTSPSTTSTIARIVRDDNVDVIVNSAGVAAIGPLEAWSEPELHAGFEVNVWGPVRVIQGAVSVWREKAQAQSQSQSQSPAQPPAPGSVGTIVNISSGAGVMGVPARSLYCASKAALESISEALVGELGAFGIRTLAVLPGAFKTNFATGSIVYPEKEDVVDKYKGTPAGQMVEVHRSAQQAGPGIKVRGDPDKAAERILEAVLGTGLGAEIGGGLRMVLGPESLVRTEEKVEMLRKSVEGNKRVAPSTDLEGWEG